MKEGKVGAPKGKEGGSEAPQGKKGSKGEGKTKEIVEVHESLNLAPSGPVIRTGLDNLSVSDSFSLISGMMP